MFESFWHGLKITYASVLVFHSLDWNITPTTSLSIFSLPLFCMESKVNLFLFTDAWCSVLVSLNRMLSTLFQLVMIVWEQIDGLELERRNSSALAMELRLSCTNPSKYHSYFDSLLLYMRSTETLHQVFVWFFFHRMPSCQYVHFCINGLHFHLS